MCITEFRCTRHVFLRKKGVKKKLKDMGFSYWATHISSNNIGYAGVCIISKQPFNFVETGVGDDELDMDGRLVMAHFHGFCLAAAYSPNAGRKGELKRKNPSGGRAD